MLIEIRYIIHSTHTICKHMGEIDDKHFCNKHTRSIKLAYHNEKTHTFEVFQKYEKIFVEKIIDEKENIL